MGHVTWTSTPKLREPVLLCAFEGWNDAGEGATTAARFLAREWAPRQFATIDPEEFYDFSSTRPTVRLDAGYQRHIEWPTPTFTAGSVPGAGLDAVVLLGNEPQLRWRTFCAEVVGVAEKLGVRFVVTLGALLAEVPHSRPVPIVGTAQDEDVIRRLDLQRSTYQGPTGIVGVLHDAFRQAGVPSASLWAAVPTYAAGPVSPKAALALVERVAAMLEAPVDSQELAAAAGEYERQLDELVGDDDDTRAYVEALEERADEPEAEPFDDTTDASFIEEVERYLRDQ